jgi:hypothetical protein
MAPNWTGYFPHGLGVASQTISIALESAKNNPAMASVIALGTGGLAIVAMPGVVATPVIGALHWAGFGVGGIIGGLWHLQERFLEKRTDPLVVGTTAASAQATIGNVVAPSLFATLTSAGAGGYGTAAISGAAQWVGGTMLGLATAAGTWLTVKE